MPTSVIVHDFHIGYAPLGPDKTDAPLVIDANAVLSLAVACQGLQPVARRTAQEVQRHCGIQLRKLSLSDALDVDEVTRLSRSEQALCVDAPKGDDRHRDEFYTVYRYSVSCLLGRKICRWRKSNTSFHELAFRQ